MKRIIYDVPRWHLLLHREARSLAGDLVALFTGAAYRKKEKLADVEAR